MRFGELEKILNKMSNHPRCAVSSYDTVKLEVDGRVYDLGSIKVYTRTEFEFDGDTNIWESCKELVLVAEKEKNK